VLKTTSTVIPCLPNDQSPLTGIPDSSALCDTPADNAVQQTPLFNC